MTPLSIAYAFFHLSLPTCDTRRFVIPNIHIFCILGLSIIWLLQTDQKLVLLHVFMGVIVAGAIWTIGKICYRKTGKDGLGIGDAKLFGAGAVLLGPALVPQMTLLASAGASSPSPCAEIARGRIAIQLPLDLSFPVR